jgi:hypothetical protein
MVVNDGSGSSAKTATSVCNAASGRQSREMCRGLPNHTGFLLAPVDAFCFDDCRRTRPAEAAQEYRTQHDIDHMT